MYYAFGIACGMAVGVAIAILIVVLIRRATHKKGTWAKYDERQQAARGRGFKYGFFAMLILSAFGMCWYSCSERAAEIIPVQWAFFACMAAGILIYASYAVWTNAYIGTNETYRSSVILFAAIAAVNLAIGILNMTHAGPEEAYLNFGIGVMMAVICIEMIAKNQVDRHAEDEDEA